MRMRHSFVSFRRALTIGTLALACSTLPATRAAAADVEILPDLVYGHKDGMAMTLDVLKPKSGANGAAILYMVSGGWVSRWAPPAQTAERFQFLLDKGFTVVVIRHGSSPRYHVPDAVSDVRRAVRYVRHNAKQWGVDSNRLGVHGGSAGGHLSLMLGTRLRQRRSGRRRAVHAREQPRRIGRRVFPAGGPAHVGARCDAGDGRPAVSGPELREGKSGRHLADSVRDPGRPANAAHSRR